MSCALEYRVYLDISPDLYQQYYRGAIKHVVAQLDDGRRIQFPASILRQVVSESGLRGWYKVQTDANNKFVGITADR